MTTTRSDDQLSRPGHASRRRLLALALLLGMAFFACALTGAVVGVAQLAGGALLPRSILLELDLTTPPGEDAGSDPLAALLGGGAAVSVLDVVEGLQRAAADDRVKGMIVTVGGEGGGMAIAQELRDALTDFRAHGKKVTVFSETFGEASQGNGGYYLASVADEIVLQPSGDVGLVGLVWEAQFLQGTLQKLDIQAQMDQRWQYKNAMNQYTEEAFTPAHREALLGILESQHRQLVAGIAAGRGLEPGEVEGLIDRGPFLATEALASGLVDRLGYRDEAYARAREGAPGSHLRTVAAYLEGAGRPNRRGPKVALVHGIGSVVRGQSGYDPLLGARTMGSDTVAQALRDATADEAVRAILFRVDSPGGSYVASDTIWHEVERARAAGKPVVVTMGNVAGSGGYYVAMSADRIVAQPGTVTGSIGVLGGKLVTRDFLANKLGVTVDDVSVSDNAHMYLSTTPYSASEWSRHQAWLDRVYDDFTAKVAGGRHMEHQEVLQSARGRIWTGEDAVRLGLVDELGGFPAALRLVKEAIGLESDDDVRLVAFPRERSLWQQLFAAAAPSTEPTTAGLLDALRTEAQPLLLAAREAGILGDDAGTLVMPFDPPRP